MFQSIKPTLFSDRSSAGSKTRSSAAETGLAPPSRGASRPSLAPLPGRFQAFRLLLCLFNGGSERVRYSWSPFQCRGSGAGRPRGCGCRRGDGMSGEWGKGSPWGGASEAGPASGATHARVSCGRVPFIQPWPRVRGAWPPGAPGGEGRSPGGHGTCRGRETRSLTGRRDLSRVAEEGEASRGTGFFGSVLASQGGGRKFLTQ